MNAGRLVLAAVAVTIAAAPAHAVPDLTAQLDAVVAPRFKSDGPGAAVLVKKGDRVLLRKGYGMANIELGVPVRPEHVFRLGSITKQFTAAAIMMLVDDGKLSLRDDVRKYVPEYPQKKGVVTIEHLLTHTGGVPSYTSQPAFEKHMRDDLSHAELLATVKDLPLDFLPGEQWAYSNSGYYLLGMVIEKVSGKSYGDFVMQRIFKPLGMTHTSYGDNEPIIAGRVEGYEEADGGRVVNAPFLSMKQPYAAGSLVSSVDDLALWDRAIRDGKLLARASWARVFTAAKLKDGSSTGYGFGWMVGDERGHRLVSHNGGINGFSTMIVRLPDDDVVAVVLCNSPSEHASLARKLALLAAGVAPPKPIALATAALDKYVGVYKLDEKRRFVVRRDADHLTAQPSGGPVFPLLAEADGTFFVEEPPIRAIFTRDKSGAVTGADVTMPAPRHFVRTDEPLPAERQAVALDE
ncbi:MAG: serine hydrolase, partial [Polyangia bacterium]